MYYCYMPTCGLYNPKIGEMTLGGIIEPLAIYSARMVTNTMNLLATKIDITD